MNRVVFSSAFDQVRGRDVRLLQEAAAFGEVHLLLWTDEAVFAHTGKPPRLPYAERFYFAQAVRYLAGVHPCAAAGGELALDGLGFRPDFWLSGPEEAIPAEGLPAGVEALRIPSARLEEFPEPEPGLSHQAKKVVVTGCYDWLHSGHLAFFEEVSALGDLYVCLGNDANIESLKGPGHPLFKADERRFLVGSMRYVTQALVSKGMGWMDAEDEILNVIRPDIYAVNEDGHKPGKASFCKRHGIQYTVLKRVPKEGLPTRSSTSLRGF